MSTPVSWSNWAYKKLYFKPKKCLTSTSLLVLYSSVLLLHDRSLLGLLGSRKIGLPSAWPPPLLNSSSCYTECGSNTRKASQNSLRSTVPLPSMSMAANNTAPEYC